MKALLVFYIAILTIALSNAAFNMDLVEILSPQVASDGYLVLGGSGARFPLRFKGTRTFSLSVENLFTNRTTALRCYFFQFEHFYEREPRIACRTNGLEEGTYRLVPSREEILVRIPTYELFINPFDLKDTFEVTAGKEVYFYDEDDNEEEFENQREREDMDFHLFETADFSRLNIYLQNNEGFSLRVTCHLDDYRLNEIECPIRATDFPQDTRFQTYDVYIEDSLGNKKYNHFVLPVTIDLEYLRYF